MATTHHCLEIFAAPHESLSLPEADRRKIFNGITKSSGPGGFKPGELTHKAELSWFEEFSVMAVLLFVVGGPLLILPCLFACIIFGGWKACLIWLLTVLFLAFHPLPWKKSRVKGGQNEWEAALGQSKFTMAVYKYFSYRFVWAGDAKEQCDTAKSAAWIGAGPPHGVLPFANLLSIPAINTFGYRHFLGGGASVVAHTPFLRYMTWYGFIEVSAKSITKALDEGSCVGLVPDGIAGIFRCTAEDEVVVLKKRKGIAKLALRTGHPIVPAYSIGNTAAFSAWFDPFGILERLSRAAQASFFVYWGRYYLPIPRRANITMLLGPPIKVEKVAEPTDAQVDEVHERLLKEMKELFDTHKAACGWAEKKIIFE